MKVKQNKVNPADEELGKTGLLRAGYLSWWVSFLGGFSQLFCSPKGFPTKLGTSSYKEKQFGKSI